MSSSFCFWSLVGFRRKLRLVVAKWPRGEKPMMLLTSLNAARSRRRLRQAVEGYLTRWRIEDTIRFVKKTYELEDVRLLGSGSPRQPFFAMGIVQKRGACNKKK